MAQQDRAVDRLSVEPAPSWGDIPAMNRHLRRLWTSVRLDAAMAPTVEWVIQAWHYDEAAREASDAALDAEMRS